MMNKVCFLVLALAFIISACTNKEKPAQEATTSLIESVEMPSSQSGIFKLVSDIEYTKDTMQQRGPVEVQRGNNTITVTGYYSNNIPLLVHAQYPAKEEWYFMQNRKVMMLKELIYEGADTSKITENQFFYNNTDLLNVRFRAAENLEMLKDMSFTKMEEMGDDYRFIAEDVNNSAAEFIYGR